MLALFVNLSICFFINIKEKVNLRTNVSLILSPNKDNRIEL